MIIAIDFGTTYTGYAFSFVNNDCDIHIMRKWEGKWLSGLSVLAMHISLNVLFVIRPINPIIYGPLDRLKALSPFFIWFNI